MARREGGDLLQRQGVVAVDDRRLAQLGDIPGQVVDEAVVVVEQEDHGVATAAARVVIRARALSSVSWYSSSGSESATMPPPTEKYARPPSATKVRITMLVSIAPVTLR